MHHELQARHPGPRGLQAQEMEVLHTRRGAAHQELQVAALAVPAQLPVAAAPTAHRHAATEQPHGALVAHALPHAACVRVAPRFRSLVRQSAARHDRGWRRQCRRPVERHRAARASPPQGSLVLV